MEQETKQSIGNLVKRGGMYPAMTLGIFLFLVGLITILALIFRIRYLVQQRHAAEAKAARLQKNLEGLLTISEATLRSDVLEDVYQRTLDVVAEVVGYSDGCITLLDEKNGFLHTVAHRNWTPSMVEKLHLIPQGRFSNNVQEAFDIHKPVFTDDMRKNPSHYPRSPVEAGYRANIIVPLLTPDRVIGALVIDSQEVHEWTDEEVRWLATIGRTLGVIIDHIRLSEQAQVLAALQERERISRELHDNLSQLICTLRVRAGSALLFLEAADTGGVREGLEIIKNISQEAYTTLRNEMLGLRDITDGDHPLVPVLNTCLDRFQHQWDIKTVFEPGNVAPDISVPSWIGVQLLRIVQEALSNTRRHAQATQIALRLKQTDGMLHVQIEDNGQGFDPGRTPDDHLGLRIMRERAESIGGSLELDSQPGQGTRVVIRVPI